MFDVLRGKIDAKKDILSKDSATGLALSPYANGMLDKIRKKREKLTNLVQSKKNQAVADKLSECLSSIGLYDASCKEGGENTIEEKFNRFYLDSQKSSLISLYRKLTDSQGEIARSYGRTVRKVEKRLFRYFSGVGLYIDVDVRKNSEVARLDPALAKPPMMAGLDKLYEHIPVSIRETLPSVSDVN